MTAELPRRSVLILSTTPPIPRDYGNRNRVFQTFNFFKRLDFTVSFLLYPFDREWVDGIPAYYRELVESFEFFAVIPNSRPLHQPARAYHHEIDEWWDDNITQHLEWLFSRRRYDAFLVNYTFLSKALEYAPRHTLKILDTHDLFSDRREMFERNGVAAEFFYTNEQQESIGFDRSDLIIAIKEYEKRIIQTMTRKPVICLPYWDDRIAEPHDPATTTAGYDHERPLRLGFIGAHNSVNIINLRRFLDIFAPYTKLYDLPVEVLIAGNVCLGIDQEYRFLRRLGFIEDIDEFYRSIDVIIAPLEFSTGIKIKVGEALARKVPVLATRNAFDGFRPYHPTQDLPNLAALCEAIVRAAYGELSATELATAARKAAITAARAQEQAFATFCDSILTAMRRVVLIVDRPFWYRANFFDEMISQSIEYLAQIVPPIVLYISEETVVPSQVHAKADYVRISTADLALPATLDGLFASYNVTGAVVIAADRQAEDAIMAQLKARQVVVWSLSMVAEGINTRLEFRDVSESAEVAVLAPLRYFPGAGQPDISRRNHVSLFVPADPDEWSAIAADTVEQVAAERGVVVRTVTVPSYHEFDSLFLSQTLDSIAERSVLILGDCFHPAYLLQLAALQGCTSLVLHPDFICPEAAGPEGTPSLEGSLRAFLAGEGAARVKAHADTGWSAVWDRISEEAAAAA